MLPGVVLQLQPRPLARLGQAFAPPPLVIEYLSQDKIVELIGQSDEGSTQSLIAVLEKYCLEGHLF